MELDRQVSPDEIMSREVELGCESWTSFASSCSSTAVQRTHCPCDSAQARLLKQQSLGNGAGTPPQHFQCSGSSPRSLRSSSGGIRGIRGIRGRVFTLSSPFPPVPVPNKPSRFCGRKAKCTLVPNLNLISEFLIYLCATANCLCQPTQMCVHFALGPQKRDGLLGTGTGGGDERVKARPRIPPEKDRRDRGPPPEQWKC